VISSTRSRMDQTTSDTRNKKVIINNQLYDRVQRLLFFFKHFIQLFSLNNSTRETIENETNIIESITHAKKNHKRAHLPILTLRIVIQVFLDHTNNDFIRNKSTFFHDLLGGQTKRRLGSNSSSEHITSS
jgi:hypothetical protein